MSLRLRAASSTARCRGSDDGERCSGVEWAGLDRGLRNDCGVGLMVQKEWRVRQR